MGGGGQIHDLLRYLDLGLKIINLRQKEEKQKTPVVWKIAGKNGKKTWIHSCLYIILKVGWKRVLTDLEATVTSALVQVINWLK